ncbi:ribonuclease H-like domain-containing protein [Tanacetum coccineum]
MTQSSIKELLLPFENPERVLCSRRKLFNNPSLVESNSPEFDQLSEIEVHIEEEVSEIMAEIMEYGSEYKDAKEHIEKVLEIVDLFHISKEVILFYNGLDVLTRQILDSKGAILSKTASDAKIAIQEMAEYSQKWHNGTSSRTRSTKTFDGLAAIQAQLNNLGREMLGSKGFKMILKVYVVQNGNKVLKRTVGEVKKIYEPTTPEEKLDRKNEMKVRGTLLMALPNKDQLKFLMLHSFMMQILLNGCFDIRLYGGGSFMSSKGIREKKENREREYGRKTMPVKNPTENALIAQDGIGGYDWSYQAEEEHPTNFSLMAYTSSGSSSSSDSEVDSSSKSCVKAYATLKEQYVSLSSDYKKSQFNLVSYKAVSDKFKTGLGYNAATSAVKSFVNSSEMLEYQENDNDVNTVESKHETVDKGVSTTVETNTVRKNNFSSPIIEDWNSDDESEVEVNVEVKTVKPSTEKIKFVKTTRKIVENVETPKQNKHYPRGNQRNWNNIMVNDTTARERAVVSENMGKGFNAVKASACWVWKAKHSSASTTFKKYSYIDARGRSKHMTGNKCYLTEYEVYDGGFVSFINGKGRISGKGKIKTGTLDFDDVCDNGTEFKNSVKNQLCDMKGIKREFSVARTPQQNGVAEPEEIRNTERGCKNMLVNSKMPTHLCWAESSNTACYVLK